LEGKMDTYTQAVPAKRRHLALEEKRLIVEETFVDGVIVVATANDPTCLDPAILKRPGRFDRVVQFRNPDADLRREYYRRLSPALDGEQFEIAIENTEGFVRPVA
jgi:ATP-dependent Zn protease